MYKQVLLATAHNFNSTRRTLWRKAQSGKRQEKTQTISGNHPIRRHFFTGGSWVYECHGEEKITWPDRDVQEHVAFDDVLARSWTSKMSKKHYKSKEVHKKVRRSTPIAVSWVDVQKNKTYKINQSLASEELQSEKSCLMRSSLSGPTECGRLAFG